MDIQEKHRSNCFSASTKQVFLTLNTDVSCPSLNIRWLASVTGSPTAPHLSRTPCSLWDPFVQLCSWSHGGLFNTFHHGAVIGIKGINLFHVTLLIVLPLILHFRSIAFYQKYMCLALEILSHWISNVMILSVGYNSTSIELVIGLVNLFPHFVYKSFILRSVAEELRTLCYILTSFSEEHHPHSLAIGWLIHFFPLTNDIVNEFHNLLLIAGLLAIPCCCKLVLNYNHILLNTLHLRTRYCREKGKPPFYLWRVEA